MLLDRGKSLLAKHSPSELIETQPPELLSEQNDVGNNMGKILQRRNTIADGISTQSSMQAKLLPTVQPHTGKNLPFTFSTVVIVEKNMMIYNKDFVLF